MANLLFVLLFGLSTFFLIEANMVPYVCPTTEQLAEGLSLIGEINGKKYFNYTDQLMAPHVRSLCQNCLGMKMAYFTNPDERDYIGQQIQNKIHWTGGLQKWTQREYIWENVDEEVHPLMFLMPVYSGDLGTGFTIEFHRNVGFLNQRPRAERHSPMCVQTSP